MVFSMEAEYHFVPENEYVAWTGKTDRARLPWGFNSRVNRLFIILQTMEQL